jgi:hypothetical protein
VHPDKQVGISPPAACAARWATGTYRCPPGIQNPVGRYAIGDRDKLETDRDSSLSLYIQNDSP